MNLRKKPTKEQVRNYGFKYNYGITLDEYADKLKAQNNCCAICGTQHLETNQVTRLHIDHCHKSKKIRGLLCTNCNKGLGHFHDNIEILKQAINYLNEQNISNS